MKFFLQRTSKIIQGFPFKEEIQVKEKEREENHTSQTSGTLGHPSFKIQSQILVFCRQNPKFQDREASWLPPI